MRTSLTPITLLVVLGLLLSSCAPATAPAPTAAPVAPAPKAAPAAPTTPTSVGAKPAAPASPPAATPKPAAEEPRYGGTLALAHPGDPVSLDGMWETTILSQGLVTSSYNGLIEYDPVQNDKITNRLAEKWEVSDDGKVYTFLLRKDVKWHDGKPFRAADVKRTIDGWQTPPPGSLWFQSSLVKMIASVEAVDDSTARITLKERQASFLSWLATVFAGMMPSHVLDAQGGRMRNTVMGTGPFKFKRYDAGVVYQAVKNENFFIKGWPYLDGLTMWVIRDASTRFAAFRAGQVHVTNPFATVSPTDAQVVEKQINDAAIMRIKNLNLYAFGPQSSKGPFKDVRVRKAASLAFDRQAAIQTLVNGWGSLGTPLPPGAWSPSADQLKQLPGYRQPKDADIAEAKRLLAEAGYPDGFDAKVVSRAGSKEYENIAVFSVDQLKRIGIRLKLDVLERTAETAVRRDKDFDSIALTVASQFSFPGGTLLYYGQGNDFGYESEKRDAAVRAYEGAIDPAAQVEAARKLEQLLFDDVPYISILWSEPAVAYWKLVRNLRPWVGHQNNNKWAHVWLAK
ncbi:MAG: ABC transporter substrate-binding protein [Chloroflexi bacterium]|nr:ABC transporter substrate-binding protein [Chloroflexota bacterium]